MIWASISTELFAVFFCSLSRSSLGVSADFKFSFGGKPDLIYSHITTIWQWIPTITQLETLNISSGYKKYLSLTFAESKNLLCVIHTELIMNPLF